MTENRPWGSYTILEDTDIYKVKRIEVQPGQRLSYQYHFKREENWTIVKGRATIVLNGKEIIKNVGENIFIPLGAKHRMVNNTTQLVVFIEVQTGTYFGEDDIVRLEDDYKRI